MSSLQEVLVAGFAGWLATNGVAQWPDVTGAYTNATPWPIYPGPDMPPTPNRCIVLTVGASVRARADITTGLQVRLRGLADGKQEDVLSKAQMITDMCYPNGFPRVHVALGLIRAGAILPGPELSMGRDGQRRFEHVLNFRLRYRRPVGVPTLGYTLTEQAGFITSPDGSVKTLVTMTQAEYDALTEHDPTQLVVIVEP